MSRWRPVAVRAALLCVACAHRTEQGAVRGPWEALERNPAGFVRQVAALRGLPNRRPAAMEFHDTEPFLRLVARKMEAQQGPTTISDRFEYYVAFHFLLPGSGRSSSPEEVQREQILAFYDETTHTIHIRRPDSSEEAKQDPRWVIAHEVGHSLQYQNFRIPDLNRITDDDTRLAQQALLEGDAMVTTLAFIAAEHHVPLRRALGDAIRGLEGGDLEEVVRASQSSPALMTAPPIFRERVIFPYLAGVGLVGTVYRAGGFDLVNRLFLHLPTTTEQVLHPDRYLAGEPAILVKAPAAPPGTVLLGSGRLGELQLRIALAECLPLPQATSAAQGWGGDRFSLVRSPRGQASLLWSTIWDTLDDAVEFEQAMRSVVNCWPLATDAGPESRFEGRAVVERQGNAVAVVRGARHGAKTGLSSLLHLAEPSPPLVAPLGPVTIQAPLRPRPVRPPYVVGRRYVDERLGIELGVPEGFAVDIEQDELLITKKGAQRTFGSVLLSRWAVDPTSVNDLFGQYIGGLKEVLGKVQVKLNKSGMAVTPLGRAVERIYDLGGRLTLRIMVLPICRMNGSLLFSQLWSDERGRAELDGWLHGLRALGGVPPICAELDG